MSTSKFAYVTVLSSDDLIPATLNLVESLRMTGTEHDIVVLAVEGQVNRTVLIDELARSKANVRLIQCKGIPNPYDRVSSEFAFLRAWQLTEYRKIVLLDSSLLVMQSIDEIFASHNQMDIVAVTLSTAEQFSTSLLVIRPSTIVFRDMIHSFLKVGSPTGDLEGYLNAYAQAVGWQVSTLSSEYHTDSRLWKYARDDVPQLSDIKILQFSSTFPWLDAVQQWTRYEDQIDSPADYVKLNRIWRNLRAYRTLLAQRDSVSFAGRCFVVWRSKSRRTSDLCVQLLSAWQPYAAPQSTDAYARVKDDVTLVTQISMDRIERLVDLATEWSGPMSVSVWVPYLLFAQSIRRVLTSNLPWQRVRLHLVIQAEQQPYPINFLRNVAADNAQSDLVFITDADFIPSGDLHMRLTQSRYSDTICEDTRNGHTYVVHAYEFTAMPQCMGEFSELLLVDKLNKDNDCRWQMMHMNKTMLLQMHQERVVKPFHAPGKGHRASDNGRWLNATQPYYVQWEEWYEPYLVLRRSTLPFEQMFDERFVDRGRNKLVLAMEMHISGMKFVVLDDAFLVHRYESKAETSGNRLPFMPARHTLYKDVERVMRRRHQCTRPQEARQQGFCNIDKYPLLSQYGVYEPPAI